MPDFIKLPSERVEQLRALSKIRNMTMADLVGEFVAEQFTKLNLPLTIPGIEVTRKGDKITADFGDFNKSFDPELAKAFAAALRWFARPKQPGMGNALSKVAEAVSGASVVGISRRGTSIKISGDTGERTLAPSIALDLAQVLLDAAADQKSL